MEVQTASAVFSVEVRTLEMDRWVPQRQLEIEMEGMESTCHDDRKLDGQLLSKNVDFYSKRMQKENHQLVLWCSMMYSHAVTPLFFSVCFHTLLVKCWFWWWVSSQPFLLRFRSSLTFENWQQGEPNNYGQSLWSAQGELAMRISWDV